MKPLATGKRWRLYSASGRTLQQISSAIQKDIPARLTIKRPEPIASK